MPDGDMQALVEGRHGDPFAHLGPHPDGKRWTVRALLPHAVRAELLDAGTGGVVAPMERVHPGGLWAGPLAARTQYRLRITDAAGRVADQDDAYALGPLLTDFDLHLLGEGTHQDLARCLGAHPMRAGGIEGVRFAVWAPNARRVSVVGDFNGWDARRNPMRLRGSSGVWELFIPAVPVGALYKYDLIGPSGEALPQKADPVAWAAERPPATASIVVGADLPPWTDSGWMAHRAARHAPNAAISIYEVHATSWLPAAHEGAPAWQALADRLAPYAAGMRFTHIELLPIMEHPFGGSWGYQPLGQFAPTSRLGPPAAFAAFVDRCHELGIGVVLDWVPAHFPTDAHGLARFDGTPLYEHGDPREGYHHDWKTYIYNLGRNEVRNFLVASALFWLEHYHVDGLRVDAVASMLYRDYSRNHGDWIPNQYGGRENLEAVAFLQDLSRVVTARCPGAMLIAEESTAWPGVTQPPDRNGLGFHYKWNMGWMHDTLQYIHEQPVHRRWHHSQITFGLIYAFSERFMLPLSHDEVVYGKGSLIRKMPGDEWQRFATLRAYFGLMWAYPGKKLLFMGGEIAQDREWDHDSGIDWHLLDDPKHAGVQSLVRDLNRLYCEVDALHSGDCEPHGFRWLVVDDAANSVFAFLRVGHAGAPPVLVVANLTPVPRHDYQVGVPAGGPWREIVNTDAEAYGGSNAGNAGGVAAAPIPAHGMPQSVRLTLPPLATLYLVTG